MKSIAIIALATTSTAALADMAPFEGVRCSPQETIAIDQHGVGFNEHTICDFASEPIFKNGTMRAHLDCANVYVLDMSTDPVTVQRTDERSLILFLKPANDIDIDVFFDGDLVGRYGACG